MEKGRVEGKDGIRRIDQGFSIYFREGKTFLFAPKPVKVGPLTIEDMSAEVEGVKYPFDGSRGVEGLKNYPLSPLKMLISFQAKDLNNFMQEKLKKLEKPPAQELRLEFLQGYFVLSGKKESTWRKNNYFTQKGFIVQGSEKGDVEVFLERSLVYGWIDEIIPRIVYRFFSILPREIAIPMATSALKFNPADYITERFLPSAGWRKVKKEELVLKKLWIEKDKLVLFYAQKKDDRKILPRQDLPSAWIEMLHESLEGENYILAGKIGMAQRFYENMLRKNPENTYALQRLIELYSIHPGTWNLAQQIARLTIEKGKNVPVSYNALASIALRKRRYKTAYAYYSKLLKLIEGDDSQADRVFGNLIMGVLSGDDLKRASNHFLKVLEYDILNREAMLYSASCFEKLKNFSRSVSIYLQLAETSKDEKEKGAYLFKIAENMKKTGLPLREVEMAYMRALKVYPSDPRVWEAIGEIRVKEGKYDEALHALERAAQIASSTGRKDRFKKIMLLEAEIWENLKKDPGMAIKKYESALSVSPEDPEILSGIGFLLLRSGNEEKARIYITKAFQIHQKNRDGKSAGELFMKAGEEFLKKGNKKTAFRYFELAKKVFPPLKPSLEKLKSLSLKLKDYETYLKLLSDQIKEETDEKNKSALFLERGIFFLKMDDELSALQSFERALELDPQNLNVISKLKELYSLRNEWQNLSKVLMKEYEISGNLETLKRVADIEYEKLKNYSSAYEKYKEIYKLREDYVDESVLLSLALELKQWEDALEFLKKKYNRKKDVLTALQAGQIYLENIRNFSEASRWFIESLSIGASPDEVLRIFTGFPQGTIPEESLKELLSLLKPVSLSPDSVYSLKVLAEHSFNAGDYESGTGYLEKALEIVPSHREVLKLLSQKSRELRIIPQYKHYMRKFIDAVEGEEKVEAVIELADFLIREGEVSEGTGLLKEMEGEIIKYPQKVIQCVKFLCEIDQPEICIRLLKGVKIEELSDHEKGEIEYLTGILLCEKYESEEGFPHIYTSAILRQEMEYIEKAILYAEKFKKSEELADLLHLAWRKDYKNLVNEKNKDDLILHLLKEERGEEAYSVIKYYGIESLSLSLLEQCINVIKNFGTTEEYLNSLERYLSLASFENREKVFEFCKLCFEKEKYEKIKEVLLNREYLWKEDDNLLEYLRISLQELGNSEDLHNLFRKIIEYKKPEEFLPFAEEGFKLALREKNDGLIKYYVDKLINPCLKNVPLLIQLFKICEEKGFTDEMVRLLKMLGELDLERKDFYLEKLAGIYEEKGVPEAKEIWIELCEFFESKVVEIPHLEKKVNYLNKLSKIKKEKLKDVHGAIRALERARNLDPANKEVLRALLELYPVTQEFKKYAECALNYLKFAEYPPEDVNKILNNLKEEEDLYIIYKNIIRRVDLKLEQLRKSVDIFEKKRDEDFIYAIDRLIEKEDSPLKSSLLLRKGKFLINVLKNEEEGIKFIEQSWKLKESLESFKELKRFYLRKNLDDFLLQLFEIAYEKKIFTEVDMENMLLWARTLERAGEVKKAMKVYDEVLSVYPKNSEVIKDVMRLSRILGDKNREAEMLFLYLKSSPEDAVEKDFVSQSIIFLINAGKDEMALEILKDYYLKTGSFEIDGIFEEACIQNKRENLIRDYLEWKVENSKSSEEKEIALQKLYDFYSSLKDRESLKGVLFKLVQHESDAFYYEELYKLLVEDGELEKALEVLNLMEFKGNLDREKIIEERILLLEEMGRIHERKKEMEKLFDLKLEQICQLKGREMLRKSLKDLNKRVKELNLSEEFKGKFLMKCIQFLPDDDEISTELINHLKEKEDYEKLKEVLDILIENVSLKERRVYFIFEKAKLLQLTEEKPEEILKFLERSFESGIYSSRLLKMAGEIYLNQGNLKKAEEILMKLWETQEAEDVIRELSSPALIFIARNLLKMERNSDVIGVLEIIEKREESPQILRNCGEIYFNMGEFDRCARCFKKILSPDFLKDDDFLRIMGISLIYTGEVEEGKKYMKEYLLRRIDDSRTFAMLPNAFFSTGAIEELRNFLREIISLFEGKTIPPQTLLELCRMIQSLNEISPSALKIFKLLDETVPIVEKELLSHYLLLLEKFGERIEMAGLFERMAEIDEENMEFYCLKAARIFREIGDNKKALDIYLKMNDYTLSDRVLFEKAEFLLSQGKIEKVDEIGKLIVTKSTSPEIPLRFVEVLLNSGFHHPAEDIMMETACKFPFEENIYMSQSKLLSITKNIRLPYIEELGRFLKGEIKEESIQPRIRRINFDEFKENMFKKVPYSSFFLNSAPFLMALYGIQIPVEDYRDHPQLTELWNRMTSIFSMEEGRACVTERAEFNVIPLERGILVMGENYLKILRKGEIIALLLYSTILHLLRYYHIRLIFSSDPQRFLKIILAFKGDEIPEDIPFKFSVDFRKIREFVRRNNVIIPEGEGDVLKYLNGCRSVALKGTIFLLESAIPIFTSIIKISLEKEKGEIYAHEGVSFLKFIELNEDEKMKIKEFILDLFS